MTSDKTEQIGSIHKVYGGFCKELTMADRFIIDCNQRDFFCILHLTIH